VGEVFARRLPIKHLKTQKDFKLFPFPQAFIPGPFAYSRTRLMVLGGNAGMHSILDEELRVFLVDFSARCGEVFLIITGRSHATCLL
jgi:hypothetical protein